MHNTPEPAIQPVNLRARLGFCLRGILNNQLNDQLPLESFKRLCGGLETQELHATAFFLALACRGSREKLGWLEEKNVVSTLIPQWGSGKGLLMDERWHRDTDVATHSLDALDMMETLVDASPTTRRIRLFAKLTAFCHDLGKHAEDTGMLAGRRTVRPNPTVHGGNPFRVALFSDHPRNSAQVFRDTLLPLLRAVKEVDINEGEIHVSERSLELHGRGIDFSRDVFANSHTPEQAQRLADRHAQRMVRSMDRALLHRHGILLGEAMQWIMMLNQMEVSLGDPLLNAPPTLSKDWTHWSTISRAQADLFPTLRRAVQHEAKRINHELYALLTFPRLVGRSDWEQLHIPPAQRAGVVSKLVAAQQNGRCSTRLEALQQACKIAQVPEPENLSTIAEQQGGTATLKQPLVERFQVWSEMFQVGNANFRATEFGLRSLGQITPHSSDEELAELIATRAYPKSRRWIQAAQLRPSDIKTILPQRGITSFGLLESFLEMSRVDPRDLTPDSIEAPTTIRGEVRILNGPRSGEIFYLLNGFQHSTQLHVGSGFAHIWRVRSSRVRNTPLWTPGEDEHRASERFLREVVLYVAGSGSLVLPSHIEGCRLIIGAVKPDDSRKKAHLYGAIVAREMPEGTVVGGKDDGHGEQLLTCYFLRSTNELKKCIATAIKKLESNRMDCRNLRENADAFISS